MAEKINYTTPAERLDETFREEFQKARWWSYKMFDSSKDMQTLQSKAINESENLRKNVVYPDAQLYESKYGNHWMINRVYLPGTNHDPNFVTFVTLGLVYGLTAKYFWVITIWRDDNTNEYKFIVFTPHFIQRFYERVGIQSNNRLKVIRNFQELLYNFKFLATRKKVKNGGRVVYGRMPGCVCYGHINADNMVTFTTIIPDSQMFINKMRESHEFRRSTDFLYSSTYRIIISECLFHDEPCKWALKMAKDKGMTKKMRINMQHYIGVDILLRRVASEYVLAEKRERASDDIKSLVSAYETMTSKLIGTPLKHRIEEFVSFFREVVLSYYDTIDDYAFARVITRMREICEDDYVDYDRFHIKIPRMCPNMTKLI